MKILKNVHVAACSKLCSVFLLTSTSSSDREHEMTLTSDEWVIESSLLTGINLAILSSRSSEDLDGNRVQMLHLARLSRADESIKGQHAGNAFYPRVFAMRTWLSYPTRSLLSQPSSTRHTPNVLVNNATNVWTLNRQDSQSWFWKEQKDVRNKSIKTRRTKIAFYSICN